MCNACMACMDAGRGCGAWAHGGVVSSNGSDPSS